MNKIRFIGLRLLQRIEELLNDISNEGNLVLMFHDIYLSKPHEQYEDYSISASSFEKIINIFIGNGYKFVSPYEILSKSDEKKVLLTFDDVFAGVYSYAFPIMKYWNIPFCIFPAIDLIDKKEYLSSSMINEMIDHGAYLGSHCISHNNLANLIDSKDEIITSKEILSAKFGVSIDFLAYPYGSLIEVGKREKKIARQYYSYAFSTLQSSIGRKIDPNFIPRININEANYEFRIGEYLKKRKDK